MKDLTGQRFGRLVAVRLYSYDRYDRWECLCDCGRTSVVYGGNLRQDRIKSCGCLRDECHVTHGESGRNRSGAYGSWAAMIQRCTNPKNDRWKDYGGRGITVCQRWRVYENFLADMGSRPKGHSLERRDNRGTYEPGKCYWAEPLEQMNNTRRNHYIEHNGKRQTVTQWARECGLNPGTLHGRLRKGWSMEKVLMPVTDEQMRTCAECGILFLPPHWKQRYCSRRCKTTRDNRVWRSRHKSYLASIEREEELEAVR